MSMIEHSRDLLALRIVDKCSVKPDKKGIKRSNGFSYKIELWYTNKIKEKYGSD